MYKKVFIINNRARPSGRITKFVLNLVLQLIVRVYVRLSALLVRQLQIN